VCLSEDVPDAAAALAAAFLKLRESETARMRDVVKCVGGEPMVRLAQSLAYDERASTRHARPCAGRPRRAGSAIPESVVHRHGVDGRDKPGHDDEGTGTVIRPAKPGAFSRRREKEEVRIGAGEAGYLGVGLAFGRMRHAELSRLAQVASSHGAELRLTPWRAILLAGLSLQQAQAAAAALAGGSLILTPDDTRLRVTACPGAPACLHATVPTQADAARLAPELPAGAHLHVSGCSKGCGQTRPAPFTLVGRENGYDLIADGTARDTPIATGLTLDEAEAMLKV
jgi:sulfite reductase beta subunit-like hemoprotein